MSQRTDRQHCNRHKQGVALTGRNTTGPPRAAAGELRCICECYKRQQTTDDDRRQRPLLVWPPTLCVGGPVISQQGNKKIKQSDASIHAVRCNSCRLLS